VDMIDEYEGGFNRPRTFKLCLCRSRLFAELEVIHHEYRHADEEADAEYRNFF